MTEKMTEEEAPAFVVDRLQTIQELRDCMSRQFDEMERRNESLGYVEWDGLVITKAADGKWPIVVEGDHIYIESKMQIAPLRKITCTIDVTPTNDTEPVGKT